MGTTTPNYSLYKPNPDPITGDFVNVTTDINNNMDTIDTQLKAVSDATTLNRPYAQLRNSTSTTIANGGSGTQVVFQTKDFDSHNGWSAVTNPTRWTCPTGHAGTYRVGARVGWTAKTSTGTTDLRVASLFKNGVEVASTADQIRALDNNVTQPINMIIPIFIALLVGDYLELHAFQNSGATLDTFVGAGGLQSMMNIEWFRT